MGERGRIAAEGDDSGWMPPLPLLALQLAQGRWGFSVCITMRAKSYNKSPHMDILLVLVLRRTLADIGVVGMNENMQGKCSIRREKEQKWHLEMLQKKR